MERNFRVKYSGSLGWLIFWTIVFFPVALLLMAINGVTFVKTESPKLGSAVNA